MGFNLNTRSTSNLRGSKEIDSIGDDLVNISSSLAQVVTGSNNVSGITGSFGRIETTGDILVPHDKKIFFDSVDTFIGSNDQTTEDLEIHADDDIILKPDDDIIMYSDAKDRGIFKMDGSAGRIGMGSGSLNWNSSNPSFGIDIRHSQTSNFVVNIKNECKGTSSDGVQIACGPDSNPSDFVHFIQFEDGNGSFLDALEGDSSGGIRFTGEAAGTYSDMRNKKDVIYLKDDYKAGDILKQLFVIEYTIKTDTLKRRQMGFSAQQLLELYPYPVSTFEEDNEKENLKPGDQGFRYHKLNQGKLMPLVVKTIQEQQKVIEELKLEIEKLKNKCQK